MEEKEIMTENINEETSSVNSESGFAFSYNLTMVCAVATVAMFVLGTALYLTVVS